MSKSKSHHDVPKLEANNYYAWSYRMEMRLHKLGVWSIVNGEESRPTGSTSHKIVKGWVTQMELALNEIVSAVGDSQLVHTRVSMDPNVVWERLESVHMSQGLGSIISMWQRFFQLKKSEEVMIQAHAASILIISQDLGTRLRRHSWLQSFSFHFRKLTVLSLFH